MYVLPRADRPLRIVDESCIGVRWELRDPTKTILILLVDQYKQVCPVTSELPDKDVCLMSLDDVMLAVVEVVGVGAFMARCRSGEFGYVANGSLREDLA